MHDVVTHRLFKLHGTADVSIVTQYIYSYAKSRERVVVMPWASIELVSVRKITKGDKTMTGSFTVTEWAVHFDRTKLAKMKLLHPERWHAFRGQCSSYDTTNSKLKSIPHHDITDAVLYQLENMPDSQIVHEHLHPTAHIEFNMDIG